MNPLLRAYPEITAGGFSRVDGTIEFYTRINALVTPASRILDFGAGRGAWMDSGASYRSSLRTLRGKVAQVVGCDVDAAVLANPSLDSAIQIAAGGRLPFETESFDLVLADYVLEHIESPAPFAAEIRRILAPGGWFCARTPNRRGYVSIAARLVPNRSHASVLSAAKPGSKEEDVFPTFFRLNTMGQIRAQFPAFENYSYYYQAEPSYHFGSYAMIKLMKAIDSLLPAPLHSNIFIFLRKPRASQD